MFAAYLIFGSILIVGFCWLIDMSGSWSTICVGLFGVCALIFKQYGAPVVAKKKKSKEYVAIDKQ